METYKERLKRLNDGVPNEAILTLTNSIKNFFINTELEVACHKRLWSLLIIGIYAVIETITDVVYGSSKDIKNIKKYHVLFVDDNCSNCNFSRIANEVNGWRNALLHQWIHKKGHYLNLDPLQKEGWKRERGILTINPKKYYECFVRAFGQHGKIYRIDEIFTDQQMLAVKDRILRKYTSK